MAFAKGMAKLKQEAIERSTRPIAVLQCHPRLAMVLTQDELDAIISLVQMANDGTDCTFRDWVQNNPVRPDFLERLELKLFEIDPTQYLPEAEKEPDGPSEGTHRDHG